MSNYAALPDDFHIRPVEVADAAAILDYMVELVAESPRNFPLTPEEFTHTLADEEAFIREHAASDNSVFLIAVAGNQILGQVNLKGGSRRATRHSAELGISVHRHWRDRGVGRKLIAAAIKWARESGVVTRIWLRVYARNARAVHLYETCGFEYEGRQRHTIFQEDQYIDDVLMGLLLDQ